MGDICARFNETKENLLSLYEMMCRIRAFEDAAVKKYQDGEIPGFIHTYHGEEAVAAGACAALEHDDAVLSAHRGHGHALAKGVSAREAMAELYGRSGGCSGGRGGSMHLYKKSIGFLGTNGMVGGGIGLANGAAFALKYNGKPNVSLSFFGDGASNMGLFYESLNLASVMKLPAIFVCENNRYATSTPLKKIAANPDIASRALLFRMEGASVDGNDALEVYEEVARAREKAVAGGGPTLIEARTYRYAAHSAGDIVFGIYRSKEEVETWRLTKDPIANFRLRLLRVYLIPEGELTGAEQRVKNEIEDAVAYAEDSAWPDPASVGDYLYSPCDSGHDAYGNGGGAFGNGTGACGNEA